MRFFIFAFVVAAALACQKSKPTSASDIQDSDFSDLDEASTDGGFGNALGNGSIAGSDALTAADKAALSKAAAETNSTAPEEGTGLPDDLLSEAQKLLEAEKSGKDVTMMKLSLANKILQDCAPKVAALAPLPGQPLLGTWNSSNAAPCKVSFDVKGPTASANVYTVAGHSAASAPAAPDDKNKAKVPPPPGQVGLEGQMTANAEGLGQVQTKLYKGNLTDQPNSGSGSLTTPEFTKTKYGSEACTTAVSLTTSTNPIPENYIEAMKTNGKCHRQALILMSPLFDNLFKTLDPALAVKIQGSALGIK